jgi:hypothetical protein
MEGGLPAINCTFDTASPECTAPANAVWRLNDFVNPNNLAYVPPPPVTDAGDASSVSDAATDGSDAGSVAEGGTDASDSGLGIPDGGAIDGSGLLDGGDASVAADGGSDSGTTSTFPTLTFNASDGNPSAGSLQLTATFTNYDQFVEPIVPIAPAANLTGRTLQAMVRLVSLTGPTTTFPGGVTLYYDTTGFCYTAGSTLGTFTTGTWATLTENASTATAGCTTDPTNVIQVGLHFYSGGAPPDGGAFPGPLTAVFEVDTVVAQ